MSEADGARFVELVADPIASYVIVNGVPYLMVDLLAGCWCHPEATLLTCRTHCMN